MNANDPALPSENDHQTGTNTFHYSGLTKRELIAAMAMQGLLANPTVQLNPIDKTAKMSREQLTAIASLQIADALIAELSKEQSK